MVYRICKQKNIFFKRRFFQLNFWLTFVWATDHNVFEIYMHEKKKCKMLRYAFLHSNLLNEFYSVEFRRVQAYIRTQILGTEIIPAHVQKINHYNNMVWVWWWDGGMRVGLVACVYREGLVYKKNTRTSLSYKTQVLMWDLQNVIEFNCQWVVKSATLYIPFRVVHTVRETHPPINKRLKLFDRIKNNPCTWVADK